MGRGIALLLLQEYALCAAEKKQSFQLSLIDTNNELLRSLPSYLRTHLKKYTERMIEPLRTFYAEVPSLVSNKEIIDTFLTQALDSVRYSTSIEEARDASLIFEAIIENVAIKSDVLKKVAKVAAPTAFFFTNTSSIPIDHLEEKSELEGRLIGFHFYNPPSIQQLIEIIPSLKTSPELLNLATTLAGRLKKTAIFSAPIAGFIGNGHFIRELHYACTLATELAEERPLYEALYIVNTVTQDLLVRPMGIFQLADYVGLDVCDSIASIMDPALTSPLITKMLDQGMRGGQHPDGSQRPGFFTYNGHTPTGIYDETTKETWAYNEGDWSTHCRTTIGPIPADTPTWKSLQKSKVPLEILLPYFSELFISNTKGAQLSKNFIAHSQSIAHSLVKQKVAKNLDDITTVLKLGFYHLYGPTEINMGSSS